MSKKRVRFDVEENEENESIDEQVSESKLPFNKKFKHTLDSDESDDELEDQKKYELNQAELCDGEEEGDLHREGEITITPFNIKDELKEGHFDKEGMFIFNKDEDEIKDNWIDNIDWAKIKEPDDSNSLKDSGGRSSDKEPIKVEIKDCLSKLIELMSPGESVQRAIQRLGKSKLKHTNRNRNKNRQRMKNSAQELTTDSKEDQEENERKMKLNSLLELSNQLLSDGDMNIHETKYETLKYRLDELEKRKDEEMDMFAD